MTQTVLTEFQKGLGKAYVLCCGPPEFLNTSPYTFLLQNALPLHVLVPLPGMPFLSSLPHQVLLILQNSSQRNFWEQPAAPPLPDRGIAGLVLGQHLAGAEMG